MDPNQRIRHYLEVTTNVAVVLVAIVALVIFGLNYYRGAHPTTPLESGLQKEIAISSPPGVNYSGVSQTLLIAMNTSCRYCTESVPFYNRLAEVQGNNTKAIRIVALFPNTVSEVRQYVEQKQLTLDTVAAADFQQLGLAGTPTVILVSNQGRILDFWVGKLSTEAEQEIIRRITG